MAANNLTRNEIKVISLASIGGALEFYDYIIFVFVANTIAPLFFPSEDRFVSLMATFATFAVTYLARPIGGILFSHYGDTVGRKQIFLITILLMAFPTFLTGCLPTYASIGVLAPILLVVMRIVQGLAVGGEIPAAITFTVEHVSWRRRGVAVALIFFGINMGVAFGQGIVGMLTYLLTTEQFSAWGWRIPFFIGGLVGVVGIYLRMRLDETPVFKAYKATLETKVMPLKLLFKDYAKQVSQGLSVAWLGSVSVYLLFAFMPVYLAQKNLFDYSAANVALMNTANLIVFSICVVFFGWLSDIVGRRPLLLLGSAGLLLLSYVIFWLIGSNSYLSLSASMLVSSLLVGLLLGTYPCLLAEMFPTRLRFTGVSVTYNISYALFGGTTPLVATYLIKSTGWIAAPGIYLMFCAMVGLVGALFITHRYGEQLA